MKALNDISEAVGNTPLVRINQLNPGPGVVYAKLEMFNPFSVKDRPAKAMLAAAEKDGVIRPGATLIEPTSGNTGIALAMLAAVKGYRMILTMPSSMSPERVKLLKALGAQVILTPAEKGMKGAIAEAERLHRETPDSFIPSQFDNPHNPEAHAATAQEIWDVLDGKVDVFVAGVGTGGTITGAGHWFKAHHPAVKIVAVEPADSPVLSGGAAGPHKIQGIGAGFLPKILDMTVVDEIIRVTAEDAGKTARELAKREGILPGISGGAALWAALQEARRPENAGKNIVAVLPDGGERYLSTWLFEDA